MFSLALSLSGNREIKFLSWLNDARGIALPSGLGFSIKPPHALVNSLSKTLNGLSQNGCKEPMQGLNYVYVELKREALKPENRRAGLMESGANTFPPFQSYFRLSPSAWSPLQGLSVLFVSQCVQSLSECICFWEPPFTFKGLNRPFTSLSTFPGLPGGKVCSSFVPDQHLSSRAVVARVV